MLVVTYNIQWGKGRDERVDLARIARTVADADVICLQEVECNWREMEHADQAARLLELLPQHFATFAPSVDIYSRDKAERARRRQYGLMTLSRWPILSARTFPLTKYPVHGNLNDQSCLHEAVISPADQPIRIYNTHLNYLSQRQRQIQVAEVLRAIDDAPRQGGAVTGPAVPADQFGVDWMALEHHEMMQTPQPALLMGDFNMRTNSPEYGMLAGEKDPCYGRLHDCTLFADALTVMGVPEDTGQTHPEGDTAGYKRIDHIFLTAELIPRVKRAWIDEKADGSDHQPVFAEFDWGK